MIQVRELYKSYGDQRAVDGVSFVAKAGRVFGLLGPNGAGKSTTIACLCGLQAPSRGTVLILGKDIVEQPQAAKKRMGVVPQELALYEELSARENLEFWASAYGLSGQARASRVQAVLERVQLLDRQKEPVRSFSGGMKRRLNFACGIVHEPTVLLLDEPTVGVDPQSRARLLELVRELARDGVCVLYTTHYMEEAETLCDELAILDHGRIQAEGSLQDLRNRTGEWDHVQLRGQFDLQRIRKTIDAHDDLELRGGEEGLLIFACRSASRRLPEILTMVEEAGGVVEETTMRQPSLETLFLELTGHELRED